MSLLDVLFSLDCPPPSTKGACLTLVEKMKKNYKKETKIQNKLNWQYCHKHNGPRYLSYQTFKWISAKSVSFTHTEDINTAHTAQFNNKTAQFNNKTAQFNKKYCSILTLLILIKRIIMLIIFNYFDCIDHIDRIGFWILIICLGHTAWAAGVTYQRSYNWDFLCFILACCLSSFPEAAL